VRIEFVSKPGISYENRGPVTLCVNRVVIVDIDRIRPLPEVEAIETIMVRTYKGELGGGTPPVVAVVEGV
jgi:hypothetical protein